MVTNTISRLGMMAAGLMLTGFAAAQQAPAMPGPAPLTLSALFGPGTRVVSDVLVGRDTPGPYLLKWRGIEPGSEIVVRGSGTLARDVDYKIDPAAGSLTFTRPLGAQEIARIDYTYNVATARPNTSLPAIPLNLDLLGSGPGALSLVAVFKPTAGSGSTSAGGETVLGLNGALKLGSASSLTSKLFLDGSGGDLRRTTGLQLADSTKTAFGQFNAGYTRAGAMFKGSDESHIAAGSQVIEAGGALNPLKSLLGLTASASFKQTTSLPSQGARGTTTVLGENLAGGLSATTRFQAAHTDTSIANAGGTKSTTVADHLQLDQKLGAATQATASVDRTAAATSGNHAVTETDALAVKSQPIQAITVSGTFQNQVSAGAAQDTANFKLDAQPVKTIKLSAALLEQYAEQGATHSRSASLQFDPNKALSLSGTYKVNAQGPNQSSTTGLNATLKPIPFLEVGGGVSLRDGMTNNAPDSALPDGYTARIALNLPKNLLKLTGSYADNPDDGHGAISHARTGQLTLQSTLGFVNFSGGFQVQQDNLSARSSETLDVKLGLQITRATQLSGGYKTSQTQDQTILTTDTYSLSLQHHVGSLFDLMFSGAMTTSAQNGVLQQSPDYEANVKLGLKF